MIFSTLFTNFRDTKIFFLCSGISKKLGTRFLKENFSVTIFFTIKDFTTASPPRKTQGTRRGHCCISYLSHLLTNTHTFIAVLALVSGFFQLY